MSATTGGHSAAQSWMTRPRTGTGHDRRERNERSRTLGEDNPQLVAQRPTGGTPAGDVEVGLAPAAESLDEARHWGLW